MAIISICENPEAFKKLDAIYSKHYVSSYSHKTSFGFVETFRKLNIETTNHFVFDSGDFALGVGSFLMDGLYLDKGALCRVLEDFDLSTFSRSRLVGNFCIAVYKSGTLTIFVDENSEYDLYYCLEENKVAITNSYYHLALAIEKSTIDKVAVAQKLFYGNILGTKSPILGIQKLQGNQCIQWRSDLGWRVLPYKRSIPNTSEDVISYTFNRFKGISKLFDSSSVFMTGGQDSRLMLAFLLAQGFKPELIYGESDSPSLVTRSNDKYIVESISEKLDLPISIKKWSENKSNYALNLEKYGEYILDYGYNASYISTFEQCDSELIESGYNAELFRNLDALNGFEDKRMNLQEFISDAYLVRKLKNLLSEWTELQVYMENSLLDLCKEFKLDESNLTYQDALIMLACTYYPSSVNFFNLANRFAYSFDFLGDWGVSQQLARIEPNRKSKSKLQILAIKSFYPPLLDYAFFSHLREQVLSTDRTYLEEKHKILVKIKRTVQKTIPKNRIYRLMRIAYRKLTGNSKEATEVTSEASLVKEVYAELHDSIVLFGIDPQDVQKEYSLLTEANLFKAYDRFLRDIANK